MPGVTFDSPVAHKQTIHILSDTALCDWLKHHHKGLQAVSTRNLRTDFERLCAGYLSVPTQGTENLSTWGISANHRNPEPAYRLANC